MQKPKPLSTLLFESIPSAIDYVLSMPDPVLWVGAIVGIILLGAMAIFILVLLYEEPIESVAGSIAAMTFGILAFAILTAIVIAYIGTLFFFTWTFWLRYLDG